MIKIRKAKERGTTELGWLKSFHTFSFNSYHDPNHHHFRKLRVINDDYVQPSQGFGTHPHSDMEIITYVLEGQLEHQDSLGNGSIINAGEIQRMSAGTGIFHSEFNPSPDNPVHLYQIWIFPEKKGVQPSYEQVKPNPDDFTDKFLLVASNDGESQGVYIGQDARLYLSRLTAGKELSFDIPNGRHVWLQLAEGKLELNGHQLEIGDGLAVSDESKLEMKALEKSEILLFDLA